METSRQAWVEISLYHCSANKATNGKKNTELENISVNYSSKRGLIFRIYKELTKFTNNKLV